MRKRRDKGFTRWLLVLAFLLAPALYAAELVGGKIKIIHAGWLLAVPGEVPLLRHSIVIDNNRISQITNGYLIPEDIDAAEHSVQVIDLSHAYVLPGLIDAHVHLTSTPRKGGLALSSTEADLTLIAARHARQTLLTGFTTVVDLGNVGVPGSERAVFAVRDAVLKGQLPGPRILAAGTPITATGMERAINYRDKVMTTLDFRSVCNDVRDCRRAVRHQVKKGSDIIVFYNTGSLLAQNPAPQAMTDTEMQAIVETAHALGRKVIADGHHAQGIAAAIRAGVDIIDSAHLYDEHTFQLFNGHTFLQSHIYGVVQAVGGSRETLHVGLWSWLPGSILERFLAIRQRPFAMTQGYAAGIRNLSYASDAGVYTWGNNAGDFKEFVARGMPAIEAIKTATVNSARMLGLERELGSIEAGKVADIIAVGSNPIDDVATLMQMKFVMRSGVIYSHHLNKMANPEVDSP